MHSDRKLGVLCDIAPRHWHLVIVAGILAKLRDNDMRQCHFGKVAVIVAAHHIRIQISPRTTLAYNCGSIVVLQQGKSSRQNEDSDSDSLVCMFFIITFICVFCLTLNMDLFSIMMVYCRNTTWIFFGCTLGTMCFKGLELFLLGWIFWTIILLIKIGVVI